ncbi:MAG: hypothetical protein M3Y33_13865, partial [Actinomycetota bacterium]|nr:hypothetical protein [Actinomycetota bacterium]
LPYRPAGPPTVSAPPVPPAAPRKVGTWELLRLREEKWAPRLRAPSLVAEAKLRPDHTDQVAAGLGRRYGELRDPRLEGEPLLLRWPACLAVAMAGVAATRYQDGTYWPAPWDTAHFPGTAQDQRIWGRVFNAGGSSPTAATTPSMCHLVPPLTAYCRFRPPHLANEPPTSSRRPDCHLRQPGLSPALTW